MLRKGCGGLYKAPTEEERRKRTPKRRERGQIKFIDLRFEDGKLQDSGKQESKTFHKLQFLWMYVDFWDKIGGLGSETCKGCEYFRDLQSSTVDFFEKLLLKCLGHCLGNQPFPIGDSQTNYKP